MKLDVNFGKCEPVTVNIRIKYYNIRYVLDLSTVRISIIRSGK